MPSAVSGRHCPAASPTAKTRAHRGAEQPVREIGAVVGAGRGAVITQEAVERGLELGSADVGAETDQAAVTDREDPAQPLRDQAAVEQEGQALVLELGMGLESEGVMSPGGLGVRATDQRAPPARAVHDHRRGEPPRPGDAPSHPRCRSPRCAGSAPGTARAGLRRRPGSRTCRTGPRRDRSGPCGSACGSRAGRGPAGRWPTRRGPREPRAGCRTRTSARCRPRCDRGAGSLPGAGGRRRGRRSWPRPRWHRNLGRAFSVTAYPKTPVEKGAHASGPARRRRAPTSRRVPSTPRGKKNTTRMKRMPK